MKDISTEYESDKLKLNNSSISEILRGEVSAFEAYEQALKKVDSHSERMKLIELKKDHERAINFWRIQAKIKGDIPSDSSGIWGTVVQGFVGAAKLFGDRPTLKVIREGEEFGLVNYKKMLGSDELNFEQKSKIREDFIPSQEFHISTIETLIETYQ
ncbi:MAG: DUF2383 domain-containing protein [Halobacteriovoraceae bacterium]|nr:DUF2383 domain-containing protein [Halobacteriovoraceae bacterium]